MLLSAACEVIHTRSADRQGFRRKRVIQTHTHMHAIVSHKRTRTCIHANVHTHTHSCKRTHAHACSVCAHIIRTYVHACMCVYVCHRTRISAAFCSRGNVCSVLVPPALSRHGLHGHRVLGLGRRSDVGQASRRLRGANKTVLRPLLCRQQEPQRAC